MDVMRCIPEPIRSVLANCGIPWEHMTELRLRAGSCCAITYHAGGQTLRKPLPSLTLSEDALREVLTRLCAGSVHAYDEGLLRGYFSPQQLDGVRVGVGGRLFCVGGKPQRLQTLTSMCIRLPHRVYVTGETQACLRRMLSGQECGEMPAKDTDCEKSQITSALFYAPPGVGKTTLLRCIIETLCSVHCAGSPICAAVLDYGEELCCADWIDCTVDRFCGYPRGLGIEIATRAFAPQMMLCDEIGSDSEADEILRAQASGVPLIATAHADSFKTLLHRPCFRRLYDHGVFSRYVRLYRSASGTGFAFQCEEAV